MATTTTSQVSAAGSPFYDRLLLQRAKPFLAHLLFGQVRPLPAKVGSQIKFRRYAAKSAATTPLTEGVTPSGSQLSVTDITATVSQYGDFTEVSDIVDITVEDPVITEAVEINGEQYGLTIDNIVRDVLSSTASSVNASNGSNGKMYAVVKPTLIDLEAYGTSYGDRAQAEHFALAA